MPERVHPRRQWLAGMGAVVIAACERTQSPSAAAERGPSNRHVLRFERVARLDVAVGAPRQIVIQREGRALVASSGGFALVESARAEMHPLEPRAAAMAVPDDDGFVLGLTPYSWAGVAGDDFRTGGMLDGDGRRQLALARVDGEWITIVQSGLREEESLGVRRQPPRGPATWTYRLPGRGVGAIAAAGRVALAIWDGRVVLLGDRVGEAREPRVLAEVRVDPPPYAIGCDDTGVSVLGATAILDHEDGGLRIAARPDWTPARAWPCTLVDLGFDGRERSRVELPFAGLQVLRRAEHVLVGGMGAASIANARIAWSRASDARVHVAVAGDDVVLAHGRTIEVVDAGGRTRATASIDDGPIACEPAVEPGGAIWVATATTVWRGA